MAPLFHLLPAVGGVGLHRKRDAEGESVVDDEQIDAVQI